MDLDKIIHSFWIKLESAFKSNRIRYAKAREEAASNKSIRIITQRGVLALSFIIYF
jgi:hypothetical protein